MKASILFVDTERVWRGGQEQLFSLVVGMRDRGYAVALACPRVSPLAAKARSSGVVQYDFQQRSELSLLALYRLIRIMRMRRFDVVHFNTPRPVLAGSCAAFLAGVPYRVCSRRVNFPLRNRLSLMKHNWLLDGIVTVSESIQETLVRNGVRPDLISVVYEGVDLRWIDSLPSLSPLGPLKSLRVGIVAHLSPEKGHKTLLEAASRLKDRFPDVSYLVIGDGSLAPELMIETRRLGLEGQVVFTGFRSDSEALMKALDVFCLPSLSEGLSSAILFAMASSLPVVATNVGGIPELVLDGQTGFLIPPLDPCNLAEALAKLFSSGRLRQEMGRAGRLRVEQFFTVDRKLEESELFYSSLLGRGSIG